MCNCLEDIKKGIRKSYEENRKHKFNNNLLFLNNREIGDIKFLNLCSETDVSKDVLTVDIVIEVLDAYGQFYEKRFDKLKHIFCCFCGEKL